MRQYCAGACREEITACCFEVQHFQNGRSLVPDHSDFQLGSRVKGLQSDGDVLGRIRLRNTSVNQPASSLMCVLSPKCPAVNARHVLSSISHAWPRHRHPSVQSPSHRPNLLSRGDAHDLTLILTAILRSTHMPKDDPTPPLHDTALTTAGAGFGRIHKPWMDKGKAWERNLVIIPFVRTQAGYHS